MLSPEQLSALLQYDTCTLANAIEGFELRLRNEGYTGPGLKCWFGHLPPMLGYAVTGRVKSSNPPVNGGAYLDRTDWWESVAGNAGPKVAVIQDIDERPGTGAVAGEVHSQIMQALGCAGLVTNGAVRDVPELESMRFPVFAGSVCPSHAYIHLVDFGVPVEINGLRIEPGDLLFGDCHGVLSIPPEIAAELPEAAAVVLARDRRIIDLCRAPGFSLERLRTEVANKN